MRRMSVSANRLFYLVVLGISLTGAGIAAKDWLDWFAPFAFLAVGAVELGGVALSVHADHRRQLGESAYAARFLSASVAIGAVLVNYFGHADKPFQAYFFAGMSALGYSVWLIDSAAKRRDALRASNKLKDTAPVYGAFQWIKSPMLTRKARELAIENPALGRNGSLWAARDKTREEKRSAAIAEALRKRITEHVDPTMATIAVNTYDLDEIANRLAEGADYDGLTAILSAELIPARLHKMTDSDSADDMPMPISDAIEIDWSVMSGTQAVQAAALALGDVPASAIQGFLKENAGKEVSLSLIRQTRRKLNGEYDNRFNTSTRELTAEEIDKRTLDNMRTEEEINESMYSLSELLPVPTSPGVGPYIEKELSTVYEFDYEPKDAPLTEETMHEYENHKDAPWNQSKDDVAPWDETVSNDRPAVESDTVLDLSGYVTRASKIRAVNDALTIDGMEAPTIDVIRGVLSDHGVSAKPSEIARVLNSANR
jgi:hypothetical protein